MREEFNFVFQSTARNPCWTLCPLVQFRQDYMQTLILYVQLRHLHHEGKYIQKIIATHIFQFTQGAAWVSVSPGVWAPDCYAHTCLSRRWQNKLPSFEIWVCLGMYVCVCALDTLLIPWRRKIWPDSCRAKEHDWHCMHICVYISVCVSLAVYMPTRLCMALFHNLSVFISPVLYTRTCL